MQAWWSVAGTRSHLTASAYSAPYDSPNPVRTYVSSHRCPALASAPPDSIRVRGSGDGQSVRQGVSPQAAAGNK